MHSSRSLMRVAACLLLATTFWPMPAAAEGALAVADMGDEGFAIGFSTNWVNAAVAHREALRRCRSFAESDAVRSRCAVISDLHRQCVAVAKRGPSEFGFGWGIDADLENAKQKALEMCKSMPGENSGDPCRVIIEKPFDACDQSDRGR